MQTIKMREAIKRMRALSELNIPFSFSYISYSNQSQTSNGLKRVEKGILRRGYRSDQSIYSNLLIAYTSYDSSEQEDRQFNYPLLMTFNNIKVIV